MSEGGACRAQGQPRLSESQEMIHTKYGIPHDVQRDEAWSSEFGLPKISVEVGDRLVSV